MMGLRKSTECLASPYACQFRRGEPNWAPLERVLRRCECYMYIGRVGQIELYKHRLTRRYINISADGRRFYQLRDGMHVEVDSQTALDHVRS
jgi:hypothetical protein